MKQTDNLLILIKGVMCSGKSTLAKALAKKLGIQHHSEPLTEFEGDLKSAYNNRENWYHAQVRILRALFDYQSKHQTGILDNTVLDCIEVYNKAYLNAGEQRLLEQEYQSWLEICKPPKPDLIIYLHADPDTLLNRIHNRGREMEQSVSLNDLESLVNYYHLSISRKLKCRQISLVSQHGLDFNVQHVVNKLSFEPFYSVA